MKFFVFLFVVMVFSLPSFGGGDELYRKGEVLLKSDPEQAYSYFIQAGELGHTLAMVGAGYCRENGHGVVVNYSSAIAWYKKASAQGSLRACERLARIYIECEDLSFHDAEGAVEFSTLLAKGRPRDAGVLELFADAQAMVGNYEKAVKALDRAIPLAGNKSREYRKKRVRYQVLSRINEPSLTERERPVYRQTMALLESGKQAEAETYLEGALELNSDSQRLWFMRGCLKRSRFDIAGASRYFARVVKLDPESSLGQFTSRMLEMDKVSAVMSGPHLWKGLEREVDYHGRVPARDMKQVRALIKKHPDELFFRWMFAVQCRAYSSFPEDAVEEYELLVTAWRPGPVLIHQTYANILSEGLGWHERALKHRKIALQLSPKSWVYQGYGNTLRELGRAEEAIPYLEKAVELSPSSWVYKANLMDARKAAGQ